MRSRSMIVGAVTAVVLGACASIPRGPALTYEQLLPNTHENPVWARNVAQATVDQPAPPVSPPR